MLHLSPSPHRYQPGTMNRSHYRFVQGELVTLKLSVLPEPGSNSDRDEHATSAADSALLAEQGLKTFLKREGKITVGRASRTSGQLPASDNGYYKNAVMSRQHATFTWTSRGITVEDAGSTHGTKVYRDGDLVSLDKSPTVLRDGDEVVFGKEVKRIDPTANGASGDSVHYPLRVRVQLVPAFPSSNPTPLPSKYQSVSTGPVAIPFTFARQGSRPSRAISSSPDKAASSSPPSKHAVSTSALSEEEDGEDDDVLEATANPAGSPGESPASDGSVAPDCQKFTAVGSKANLSDWKAAEEDMQAAASQQSSSFMTPPSPRSLGGKSLKDRKSIKSMREKLDDILKDNKKEMRKLRRHLNRAAKERALAFHYGPEDAEGLRAPCSTAPQNSDRLPSGTRDDEDEDEEEENGEHENALHISDGEDGEIRGKTACSKPADSDGELEGIHNEQSEDEEDQDIHMKTARESLRKHLEASSSPAPDDEEEEMVGSDHEISHEGDEPTTEDSTSPASIFSAKFSNRGDCEKENAEGAAPSSPPSEEMDVDDEEKEKEVTQGKQSTAASDGDEHVGGTEAIRAALAKFKHNRTAHRKLSRRISSWNPSVEVTCLDLPRRSPGGIAGGVSEAPAGGASEAPAGVQASQSTDGAHDEGGNGTSDTVDGESLPVLTEKPEDVTRVEEHRVEEHLAGVPAGGIPTPISAGSVLQVLDKKTAASCLSTPNLLPVLKVAKTPSTLGKRKRVESGADNQMQCEVDGSTNQKQGPLEVAGPRRVKQLPSVPSWKTALTHTASMAVGAAAAFVLLSTLPELDEY